MADLVSAEDDVNLRVSTGLSAAIDEGCRMTMICLCVPSDTTVSEWQRGADNRKVSPRVIGPAASG